MLSLFVDAAAASSRRRRDPARRRAREAVARALAQLCDVCGGAVGGGAVLYGPVSYCSTECAFVAKDRFVAGNYLG